MINPKDKNLILTIAAIYADSTVQFNDETGTATVSFPNFSDAITLTLFRKTGPNTLLSIKTKDASLPWVFNPNNVKETLDSLKTVAEELLGYPKSVFPTEKGKLCT